MTIFHSHLRIASEAVYLADTNLHSYGDYIGDTDQSTVDWSSSMRFLAPDVHSYFYSC